MEALRSVPLASRTLTETIKLAFTALPINPDERGLTVQIARNPGIGYQALVTFRGKGDVGLILGHMVYERLGFFRKFLEGSGRLSDLLFTRDDAGGKMTYRLTAEAGAAFRALGLFESPL